MFRRDDLRAIGEYALALFAAAARQEPMPPEMTARWAPYHLLLGEDAVDRRLAPIYAAVANGGAAMSMPEAPLTLTRESLFPIRSEPASLKGSRSEAMSILERVVSALAAIDHDNARYGFETLHSCMERFATNQPGTLDAAGLSLFRQFALTTALYAASGAAAPANTCTLIGSDTPGIQKFIGARLTSKGAAKGLRGRSFFLQLVTDAVALRILDALDLPRANLLYAAGGNLLILAPNGVDDTLRALRHDLSGELMEWSSGQIDQALAWTPIESGAIGSDARPALHALRQKLAAVKRRPYGDLLADAGTYDALFAPERRYADTEPADEYGELADAIARASPDGSLYLHRRRANPSERAAAWQLALHRISNGWLYTVSGDARPGGAPVDFLVDVFNESEKVPAEATAYRFAGITTPRDPDGSIREIQEIAGVTPMGRVGVLRMDVDNLGAIFGRELQPGTLAAICTLSSSLDRFFAGWVNVICDTVQTQRELSGTAPAQRGDLLYTIYSGGDDLFVVGAWDRLPALADAIRADFSQYCAHNPALQLSAGIAIDDARFPLYQLAETAGDALDAAKGMRHPTDARSKNAVSFLDHLLPWEAFDDVMPLVARLSSTKAEPSALMGRLRDLALLDREERQRFGLPPADPYGSGASMVGRARWRGLVALRRAAEQYRGDDREFATLLIEFERQLIAGTMTPHLALVTRWADLLWRASGSKERT